MIRINLLPPEITEKRRFEQRIAYVAVAGVFVFLVLAGLYAFASWQVGSKNEVLQQNREAAAQLLQQAQAYEVFQEKEDMLRQRIEVAQIALASRADWGRVANELSLVLPSDVWLTFLGGSESEGLELAGRAVDSDTDVPDVGHKAVAKTLVRLAELELLESVWLNSSAKADLADTNRKVIEFTVIAGIVRPEAPSTEDASVPAPPDQTAP